MLTRSQVASLLTAWIGLMWALPSSLWVYHGWRVAFNASRYQAADAEIQSVRYWKGRHGGIEAFGEIKGRKEKISLADFGPYHNSQEAWEAAYPKGKTIPIWYDPSAPANFSHKSSLRVLPRSYRLDDAWWIAITTTLKHEALLIFGLVLCYVFSVPPLNPSRSPQSPPQLPRRPRGSSSRQTRKGWK